ncbi:hypothetical protein [Duganella sp. P38]|uniref:hypothetical protein n=1 Tax=Duganella sp. P38 TaxID=3423949 RepID=UPI003D7B6A73
MTYRPRTVSGVSPNSESVTWPLASVVPLAGSMLPNSDTSALACGAPSLPTTLMTAFSTGPPPSVGVTPVTIVGRRSSGSIMFSGWSRSTSRRPWPCWCSVAAFCSVMRATSTPWLPPRPSASAPSTDLGPSLSITSMSLLLRRACSSASNRSGCSPSVCRPSDGWRGAMTNCFLRAAMLRPVLSARPLLCGAGSLLPPAASLAGASPALAPLLAPPPRRLATGLPLSAGAAVSPSPMDVLRSGGVLPPPLGFLGMMFLSKGGERAAEHG